MTDASNGEEDDEEEEDDDDDDENEDQNDECTDHGVDDANSVAMPSSVSSQAELTDTYHSPLSIEFPHSGPGAFTHSHNAGVYPQSISMGNFGLFTSLDHNPNTALDGRVSDFHDSVPRTQRSMSSESHSSQLYTGMHNTALPTPSTSAMFFSPVSNGDPCDMSESPFAIPVSPDCHGDQASHVVSRGMPTPTDSFKSPPPPANIASRRKIPRPVPLQAASLRSRPFNSTKTALDGAKRMDLSSPGSSMRRISSATGMGPGRIQKSSAGPRSPFVGRAEALWQYHNSSPVGSGTPTFPGAAPPTPMTPAVFDHHGHEPAVISASPDDGSFALGMGLAPSYMQEMREEHDLKTPPTTPGMMTEFGATGFVGNPFGSGFNITTDQPLLTPYFHSEFPELSVQTVPSYVETGEVSPSTPVYPSMMSSNLDHPSSFTGNPMANTQYDWDANESVVSSRSSPGYPRSKQIQFTPNITPQDYH